ncbi:MAG: cadherin repeat domain-containing protein [Ekhidna sp.]|nr:cadherin repeat domain-containing protein [Ekhidna sp.]
MPKIVLFSVFGLALVACGDDDCEDMEPDKQEEPENTAPAVVNRTFTVKEDAINGTAVGTVKATDAEKDKLTFSINSGNTDNVFEINAASGVITVAGTLDFENTPDYTLAIKVSDRKLAGTADITVNVTDVDVPGEYLPQRDIPANIATSPIALWSDGTTIWVVDNNDAKLYAYTLATKARDAAKDIDLDADNANPSGLWSNKTTIWVTDWNDAKLYAYTLATRVRDAAKDIDLDADNDRSVGIWSDGTTLWVVQNESGFSSDKLYAYTLATGVRDAAKDIDLDADNILPLGLWSDNTTIWVADTYIRKLYAYTLATGERDVAKDFDRLADFRAPTGLWSDGTIIWVAKPGRFYAYRLK